MRTSAVFAVVAVAGAALAQIPGLPTCATNCADTYLQQGIGNCGTDPACICANGNFIGGIACCLVGACDPADQTSAVAYASSLCAANGVTVPAAVSCTATLSSSGSMTSASGSTTSSAPGTVSTSASSASIASVSTVSSTAGTSASTSGPVVAVTSSSTHNHGPRQTAGVGLGALGGLVAAVAML